MPISPVCPILMDCPRLSTNCALTVNISRVLASAPPTDPRLPVSRLAAAFYEDTEIWDVVTGQAENKIGKEE